jgi:hypothetical protein
MTTSISHISPVVNFELLKLPIVVLGVETIVTCGKTILQNIAARQPALSGHVWSQPFDLVFQSILTIRFRYCLPEDFYPPETKSSYVH